MSIFAPSFRKIATGLHGAEGPVFTKDGEFYMVSPTREGGGDIVKVDLESPEGEWKQVCAPRFSECEGLPAGLQCDKQNKLWVADMRHGILSLDKDGTDCQQIARVDSDGQPLQGCNDCIFDNEGNLWVSAPAGPIAPAEYTRSSEEAFGSVYCYTKDKVLKKVDTGYQFSNGLAVQHAADGKPSLLIVAETYTKILHAYNIVGPGEVCNKRFWGKVPGSHNDGPDGMDFDSQGNLLVTNHGGSHIEVYSPDGGDPWCSIQCPFTMPSNVHFKPNTNQVFVTEHDTNSLWTFEWKHTGMKQYCEI